MTRPLKFLSEQVLAELRRNVTVHRERYIEGDFLDLERDNGWAIESTQVMVDPEMLATLDGTVRTGEADAAASLTVYRALTGMTPALACEERVWARLTHVECLRYARDRWLAGADGEKADGQVHSHFFARGRTGVRDDNALSRLWWNAHIAAIADPEDMEGALQLMLRRADIRLNFVERTNTAARRPLARAVIRAMRRDPWITGSESAFREFMKVLNREGGGLLLEVLPESRADELTQVCVGRARAHLEASAGVGEAQDGGDQSG